MVPEETDEVLVGRVKERLKQINKEITKERQAEILGMLIMADHVCLLVEVDPQYGFRTMH